MAVGITGDIQIRHRIKLGLIGQKPDLENAMSGHILAQTVLVGLYRRK